MEQHQYKIITPDTGVRDGLIFIPDISGFTELVQSTDLLTGKQITCELLSAIISQNNLQLNIAEVEGDAILFYRFGMAPTIYELVEQYERMKNSFEKKLHELQIRFSQTISLSLKVIAHYGAMTEYNIGPFQKLYGKVLIEAHRLLKNTITSDSYLLLTDSLIGMAGATDQAADHHGVKSVKLCEVYGSLKNICFSYLDFREQSTVKKVA